MSATAQIQDSRLAETRLFDTTRMELTLCSQAVESMYHMWLGSNGLPISPRKQRAKLFEFCTTHFVTEAEMRYCFARLLSVGNPSGPVKYAGQPQYDSEQVVSPLFTFAMPAAPPPAAASAEPATLSAAPSSGAAPQVSLAYLPSPRPQPAAAPAVPRAALAAKPQPAAAAAEAKLEKVQQEVASLKAQLHALAAHKAAVSAALARAPPPAAAVRSQLSAAAAALAAQAPAVTGGGKLNSVFDLPSVKPWFHKEHTLAI